MNLLFLIYNNYFNRIVKKENSLNAYISAAPSVSGEKQYNTITNINFHEGDLIDTEIIINWDKQWFPDYLVCYEGELSENKIIIY